jgi:hypothetical protein
LRESSSGFLQGATGGGVENLLMGGEFPVEQATTKNSFAEIPYESS